MQVCHITLYNGITGEVHKQATRRSFLDAIDLAVELLAEHLLEFITIGFSQNKVNDPCRMNERIYTLRYPDGTYAPIECKVSFPSI